MWKTEKAIWYSEEEYTRLKERLLSIRKIASDCLKDAKQIDSRKVNTTLKKIVKLANDKQ